MSFNAKEVFGEMANGNAQAEEFLHVFYRWVHTLDDLVDRDKDVSAEAAASVSLHLMHTLSTNLFWCEHQAQLMPVILVSTLAFISSEDFVKHEDVFDRVASQVIKSQYMDVFFYVSFLTGGYQHALEMNRKHRAYCPDPVPAPSKISVC